VLFHLLSVLEHNKQEAIRLGLIEEASCHCTLFLFAFCVLVELDLYLLGQPLIVLFKNCSHFGTAKL